MRTSRFNCLFVAAFMAFAPGTPSSLLEVAKYQLTIGDKVSALRQMVRKFPSDPQTGGAREQLIALLIGSNRYDEALQAYREEISGPPQAVDFKLLDYLLKTGHYAEALRDTSVAPGPVHDFIRDQKILEVRVQALLASGRYQVARECVDRWLANYAGDGIEGGRFEGDVRSIQFLRRHLAMLEREVGPKGKSIFTAAVPESLMHWSQRRDVPIYFFKLIPAHPGGQIHEPLLPGRHAGNEFFAEATDTLNRGFQYLSHGEFSLHFEDVDTLYIKEGDLDPTAYGGSLLTSRVYVHTIPELYRLAGDAFIVLVDYRDQAGDEAAYMGDGIIHLSANKFKTLVLMHEILHGLGATHREWNYLESQGYRFDPDDRGLMTFDKGELRDLGLEEKNRSLLGWPQVSVIHFKEDTTLAQDSDVPQSIALATPPL
jgi:tetratricopeptide (TPR) repeat protein